MMTTETREAETKQQADDECAKKKIRCKTLIIHGAKYRTTLTKKYMNRKQWEKPDPRHIRSFIPGTVKEVTISKGDVVKKGDQLLIVEAMKMLNIIESPSDGIVKKVHIEPEKKIPKGCLMVELE